jgi:hypothetical protein
MDCADDADSSVSSTTDCANDADEDETGEINPIQV